MGTREQVAFHVRPARAEDAARIAGCANALNAAHGGSDTLYSEATIRDHAFGPRLLFDVLVAEHRGAVAGYASYQDLYNTDLAEPGPWLIDLYVNEALRGQGAGYALMTATARAAVDWGATSVWWGVDASNRNAREFYARLGARDGDARILELDGTALAALAERGQS